MDVESSEFVLPESFSREVARNFGPYEIIAELARGGMGRVFLARLVGEGGFERLFAIKVMHDHLANEEESLLMLLDEANIASQIHHPNVVPITDLGVHEGRHFLVMEYVEGCSLSELLRQTDDDYSPSLLIPLLLDALRGLHGAHELKDFSGLPLNLIHRDFSPPNLLVGVDGICRVIDFGIAKAKHRLTHTQTAVLKGKISYLAPEQILDDRNIDRRVDVWAAGVVLWIALTGEHPFRGQSEAGTIHQILGRELPPPSTVGARPPACFDDLCLKALARDRSQRFGTAQELADELQRIAVRHNLLAPHSKVAAWVREAFSVELEQRRQLIRAFQDEGQNIAWISAPVLPRLVMTPTTTNPRRVGREILKEAPRPREVECSRLSDHKPDLKEASGLRDRCQVHEEISGLANRRPETPFIASSGAGACHQQVSNASLPSRVTTPVPKKSRVSSIGCQLVVVPDGPPPLKPALHQDISASTPLSKDPRYETDLSCPPPFLQNRRGINHFASIFGAIVAGALSLVVSFVILALFDVAVPSSHDSVNSGSVLPGSEVDELEEVEERYETDDNLTPGESENPNDTALEQMTSDLDLAVAGQGQQASGHQGNAIASERTRSSARAKAYRPRKRRSKSKSRLRY